MRHGGGFAAQLAGGFQMQSSGRIDANTQTLTDIAANEHLACTALLNGESWCESVGTVGEKGKWFLTIVAPADEISRGEIYYEAGEEAICTQESG